MWTWMTWENEMGAERGEGGERGGLGGGVKDCADGVKERLGWARLGWALVMSCCVVGLGWIVD